MAPSFVRILLAALLLPAATLALAQAYPAKPVRWLIPYSAGGPTDVLARAIAPKLSESLGVPVIVENRLGAGGSIAMDSVAKAPPDGYLIGMGLTGTHAINPHLYAKLPYDPLKDFAPITPLVSYVNILVCNPSVPVRSAGELVAHAKANPDRVAYASGGRGASNHLAGELLKALTGAPLVHVPYKGNAPAMTDVLGGTVACMFDILSTALPHVRSGKVRAIAVAGKKRSAFLPEVPTMQESGVPGYDEATSDLWLGVFAPPGTPRPIVERLHADFVKAMAAPEVAERVRAQAYDVWTLRPEEFSVHLRRDLEKWGAMVKSAGLAPE